MGRKRTAPQEEKAPVEPQYLDAINSKGEWIKIRSTTGEVMLYPCLAMGAIMIPKWIYFCPELSFNAKMVLHNIIELLEEKGNTDIYDKGAKLLAEKMNVSINVVIEAIKELASKYFISVKNVSTGEATTNGPVTKEVYIYLPHEALVRSQETISKSELSKATSNKTSYYYLKTTEETEEYDG